MMVLEPASLGLNVNISEKNWLPWGLSILPYDNIQASPLKPLGQSKPNFM